MKINWYAVGVVAVCIGIAMTGIIGLILGHPVYTVDGR